MIAPYFKTLNELAVKDITLAIAVPNIYLREAQALSSYPIWAQDVESFGYGAHTGRLSYQHLLDNNIGGCLIGHSEQRVFDDNTNAIIQSKVAQALSHGLQVVLCVGENMDVYQKHQTSTFVQEQISSALAGIAMSEYAHQLIIAYEPIWAIGTGQVPTPEVIEEVAAKIKSRFPFPVVYGGSVNSHNITELLQIPSIDGFLVGGASWDVQSFSELIQLFTK